ncbi:MAG TPA: 30S ribosomal protein S27ae [archaeon]|nr:30S ribosomal protein S27ae [archaeon]
MGEEAAVSKKGRKVRKREKKQRKGKKHSTPSIWKLYSVSGTALTRKGRNCPRCGPGTTISQHKNRSYCGKCGYTELKK